MQGNPTDGSINESSFPVDGGASRGSPSEQDNSRERFIVGRSSSAYSSTSPSQCSYHQIPVQGAGASTSAGAASRRRRLRGSCDFCTKRKRKCDGDGVHRCSLCVAKNQAVCHYSERLATGPKPQIPPPTADSSSILGNGGNSRMLSADEGGCNPREYLGAGQRRSHLKGKKTEKETKKQRHQSLGSATERTGVEQCPAVRREGGGPPSAPLVSLKRARLSPSPATGLVGLKENVYIGDFFRALGFLPFTDESDIRKAMIATMFDKLQQQAGDDYDGGSIVPSMRSAEVRAATCVLWCTVALGYLVQGRPKELVVGYTNLAREALSGCFDDGSVGTARAFISMAILQNFLGDEMKYRKHLDFAKSIVSALPPGVIPEELKVTILHMRVCDTFWLDPERFGNDCWELKTECATLRKECSEIPDELLGKTEKPNIFRRTDLYRWLIQLDVRMGHSFHKDMFDVGLYDDISNSHTLTNQNCPTPDVVEDDSSQTSLSEGGEIVDPPPPGDMSRKFAASARREFNALKDVTEIAEIRDGVGELYIRSIMAYVYRLEGSFVVSFDNLQRCGEVIVKHPGLCRFTSWKHIMHCILKAMAVRGNREKYSELRDVYNSIMNEPGMVKIPPFEEFTGVSDICDAFFCRSICSDQIREVGEISTPSSEDRIQEVSPLEVDFPDFRNSITPPPPPSLKSASSLSSETPQDGQEQLQPAAPVDHPSQSQRLTSAFTGGGVAASGTGLHVPGVEGGESWVEWNSNSTGPEDGGVKDGSSSDWYSGNSSRSKSSSGDVRTGAAAASAGNESANGNEDSGFSGVMSCFREEQLLPLPFTSTAVNGLEVSDSAILMDAVDAFLGDTDLEEVIACDDSGGNQSWSGMEFQTGGKDWTGSWGLK